MHPCKIIYPGLLHKFWLGFVPSDIFQWNCLPSAGESRMITQPQNIKWPENKPHQQCTTSLCNPCFESQCIMNFACHACRGDTASTCHIITDHSSTWSLVMQGRVEPVTCGFACLALDSLLCTCMHVLVLHSWVTLNDTTLQATWGTGWTCFMGLYLHCTCTVEFSSEYLKTKSDLVSMIWGSFS